MASLQSLCEDCAKDCTDHMFIQLAELGKCIDYTIPSFPVFQVKLQHAKYTFFQDQDDSVYDGLVQAKNAAELKVNCVIRLCSGYTNAFVIEQEEFSKEVDVSGLKLVDGGKVFVMWKWNMHSGEVSEAELPDEETIFSEDEEPEASASATSLYSVVFKCVGTTKQGKYQQVLSKAAAAMKRKEEVKARIVPEPNNPFDAKAIAFQIFTGAKWERVGYAVTEVLDALHQEILHEDIAVELEWVKYITHWCRSTPGWYCGIKITKKGPWGNNVLRCRSTI